MMQSEGSTVWMTPPVRDISAFQAGSFYNLPPQGQQVAFATAQTGHAGAAFTGIYHPTQSVAGGSVHPMLQQSQAVGGAPEMTGPPVGMYQQPQRASPLNWINNY